MPSPLGHSLAGLTVHVLTARDRPELGSRVRIAVALGAALAPDLDLLLRWVDGRNHHQGLSHSVGAAAVATLVVLVASRLLGGAWRWGLGLLAGLAWLSHLVLDYLGVDTHPPIGIPALWPFSHHYFKSPWSLFLDIGRTLDWATLRHDALAGAWEVATLLPLLVVAWRLRHSTGD
jgi:inner membrane protein